MLMLSFENAGERNRPGSPNDIPDRRFDDTHGYQRTGRYLGCRGEITAISIAVCLAVSPSEVMVLGNKMRTYQTRFDQTLHAS